MCHPNIEPRLNSAGSGQGPKSQLCVEVVISEAGNLLSAALIMNLSRKTLGFRSINHAFVSWSQFVLRINILYFSENFNSVTTII